MSQTIHDEQRRAVRILVADADEDTRSLYRVSLGLAGCEVVDATDGRDALVKALSEPPALVITETHLPVFDGYALCEVLRRDSLTCTVPILVVTTETRDSELDRARAAGADAVLIKPVASEALLSEIQRLLAPDRSRKPTRRVFSPTSEGPRRVQTRAHRRFETTAPPTPPPELFCPSCDRPLTYERSHIGGVSSRSPERWDDYSCPGSCGRFEYRHRTRNLRFVSGSEGHQAPERRRYRSDAELRKQREEAQRKWNERRHE